MGKWKAVLLCAKCDEIRQVGFDLNPQTLAVVVERKRIEEACPACGYLIDKHEDVHFRTGVAKKVSQAVWWNPLTWWRFTWTIRPEKKIRLPVGQ